MLYFKFLFYVLLFSSVQSSAKDYIEGENLEVISFAEFVISISGPELNKLELQNAKLKHNPSSHSIVQAFGEFSIPMPAINLQDHRIIKIEINNRNQASCFRFASEDFNSTNSVCLWLEEDSYKSDSKFLKVHASVSMFQNYSSPYTIKDFENKFKAIIQRAAMLPESSDKRLDLSFKAMLELNK